MKYFLSITCHGAAGDAFISMASSNPFFDDIRSHSDVDPPQNEELIDVSELVNDPTQTALKPNGIVSSSVRELLECPVCLNAMYPPIHQCSNGHTICSGCKPKVHNQCPTCRHELGNISCLALEKVAASLELPCKYQGFGCIGIYPYYSKLKHESQCVYRPYTCPYAGSECSVMGDIPYLVAHLKDDHKVDMHNVQNYLIHMYGCCGAVELAMFVFDTMLVRDLVSWNSIIDGHVMFGDLSDAHKLFDRMPERNSEFFINDCIWANKGRRTTSDK